MNYGRNGIWSAMRPQTPKPRKPLVMVALTLLSLAIAVNLVTWVPWAYAHFSSCSSFFSCSGGALSVAGVLPIANGGTGGATAAAGFNALSPMTTAGDVIKGGASGAGTRVPLGTAGQTFKVNAGGTDVEWGTAAIAGGGTGATTATEAFDNLAPTTTAGDLIVHNGTDNVRFAKGTDGKIIKMVAGALSWEDDSTGSASSTHSFSTTPMDLNADALYVNPSSGMLCATQTKCKQPTQTQVVFSNFTARADAAIGGTNNTVELAQGSCDDGTDITFDCQSGDLCVTIASTDSDLPTTADSDDLTVSAGNCYVGKITASGNTNADVVIASTWDQVG